MPTSAAKVGVSGGAQLRKRPRVAQKCSDAVGQDDAQRRFGLVQWEFVVQEPKKRPEGPSGSHAAAQRPSSTIGMLMYYIYAAISVRLAILSLCDVLDPPTPLSACLMGPWSRKFGSHASVYCSLMCACVLDIHTH